MYILTRLVLWKNEKTLIKPFIVWISTTCKSNTKKLFKLKILKINLKILT